MYHRDGNTETVTKIVNFLFGILCNVGVSRKNLHHHEDSRERDILVAEGLYERVAETCINQKE